MTTSESEVSSSFITELYSDAGLAGESPAKRPNKRGQQTRERLIQAATECFTEYGYTRTRISDVVHRAGTAQGNFYRHFASLDEAFLAVIRTGLEELANASTRRSGHSTDLASLIETNTTYLHTYARHRHILRLLREAAAASPNDGFQSLWLRLRGDFVGRTKRWLVRLREAGTIEDVDLDLLAETLGCLTEQLAYVHVGLPSTTPRLERIDELGKALGEAWYRLIPRADAG
ncbi:TetR/AcrR family transcriptional regulator [Nocardioides sp. AE5]|uniref:TetR/AcrR family transcriptional regulator n=1 Tax=Nocardioides sp. AE5 TaxID=2962573 RepID=UPI002882A334|nr:TetR/AcrR family transcriptional regulator [Nocardioides sp. AE5]MDT0201657.1 TetR/AcrR family transcriptional regulator [Nocardioides sp. AE5]